MKKLLYTTTLFVCFLHWQSCTPLKRTFAWSGGFYYVPTPGTIPVDENGKAMQTSRDTVFILFVETKGSNLEWDKAWRNGKLFPVSATKVKQAEIVVGETKSGNQKVVLSAPGKNTLWQPELLESSGKEKAPRKSLPNAILLMGRRNNRPFIYEISSVTELNTPLFQ